MVSMDAVVVLMGPWFCALFVDKLANVSGSAYDLSEVAPRLSEADVFFLLHVHL